MDLYGDLRKMMDVASGRRKASLVLKGGTVVNVFTEKTEVADIAIEDGYIAGIGDYEGAHNVDLSAGTSAPALLTVIYILKAPWCHLLNLRRRSCLTAPRLS